MPRPAAGFWQNGEPPFLFPGLNTDREAILDYAEEAAANAVNANVLALPFSKAIGEVSVSAPWRVPNVSHRLLWLSLMATTGPVGAALVTELRRNNTPIGTLTMPAGITPVQQAVGLDVLVLPGEFLTAVITSTPTGADAPTGITLQVDYRREPT